MLINLSRQDIFFIIQALEAEKEAHTEHDMLITAEAINEIKERLERQSEPVIGKWFISGKVTGNAKVY